MNIHFDTSDLVLKNRKLYLIKKQKLNPPAATEVYTMAWRIRKTVRATHMAVAQEVRQEVYTAAALTSVRAAVQEVHRAAAQVYRPVRTRLRENKAVLQMI